MKNPERPITLRETRDEGGTRYLGARMTDSGDLIIEGQDLGPGVTECFGPGITEYEWSWTITKAAVPSFIKALGGAETEDILGLLKKRFSGETAGEVGDFLIEHHIQNEFWNRCGD